MAKVSHYRVRFLARTEEPAIDIDVHCFRVERVPNQLAFVRRRIEHAVAGLA